MIHAVRLAVENLMLNAPSPNGILASASPLTFVPPAPATSLDLIADAIAQLESQGYTVDAIVLSAQDAFAMRMQKTTLGTYLWADPDASVGSNTIWDTRVIISPSMPPSFFVVGGFGQGCLYFDRQRATVDVALERRLHPNLVCLTCECSGVLAIPVPAALVKGTFATGL